MEKQVPEAAAAEARTAEAAAVCISPAVSNSMILSFGKVSESVVRET